VIDDLTVRDGLMRHIEVVRSAQLIFVDAAKDGRMLAQAFGRSPVRQPGVRDLRRYPPLQHACHVAADRVAKD
jgi:hypothetical protein